MFKSFEFLAVLAVSWTQFLYNNSDQIKTIFIVYIQ